MDNVTALKNLYVALGGTAADVADINTNAGMIDAIATVAAALTTAANTAELPAVKAANNGQVLTVVNGKWAAAALPE